MPTIPAAFSALTLDQARTRVSDLKDEGAAENLTLYGGDHWLKGKGWIGEKPVDDDARGVFMAAVEAGFISVNHVGEVTDRHTGGVLGREPLWKLTVRRALGDGEEPNPAEQALIAEAEAALTDWWDERDLLQTLQPAGPSLLLASRAVARLYVPRGLRRQGPDGRGYVQLGDVPDGDTPLARALSFLYVDLPPLDQAGVFTDGDTKQRLGVYTYRRADPDNATVSEEIAEITHLDQQGRTVVRVLEGGTGRQTVEDGATFPLGGRLTMYEATRRPLIGAQLRQLQKAANLNLSNLGRNLNVAGSRERTFLNTQPPGEWRRKSDGQPWQAGDDQNDREFVAGSMPTGAGFDRFAQGTPIYNERQEIIGIATPAVHYEQPVSIETFSVANTLFREAILAGAHQSHALISKDATASGESRKQARAEYDADLHKSAAALNGLGRWLIETALAFAAVLAGQPDRYAGLRCNFGCVIDAGPVSADEQRAVIELRTAGLRSLDTALSETGIEDTDEEANRIQAEEADRRNADVAGVSALAGAARGQAQQGNGQVPPAVAAEFTRV